MKLILVILMIFTFSSCGKKKTDVAGNTVNDVYCKTLRSENPSKCVSNTGMSTPVNEICELGFGSPSLKIRITPSLVKSSVDNGSLILISKETGKRLSFKTFLDINTNQSYLIVQQEGDVGFSSTVALPACSDN